MKHRKLSAAFGFFIVPFVWTSQVFGAAQMATITAKQDSAATGSGVITMWSAPDDAKCLIRNGKMNVDLFFKPAQGTVWVADNAKKTIMKINTATFAASKQRLRESMSALKKQIGELTPEQQAAAKKMLAGLDQVKTDFKYSRGQTGLKYNGFKCDEFKGVGKGFFTMVLTHCVSPWSALPIQENDLKSLTKLMQFLSQSQDLLGGGGGGMSGWIDGWTSNVKTADVPWKGLPVRTLSQVNGKQDYTLDVQTIRMEPIPPNAFDLPKGYSEQSFPP